MLDLSAFGIDTASLEGAIGSAVVAQLAPLLSAGESDLREFGLAVAKGGLAAHLAGNKPWSDEVKAQARGLLEMSRIRADGLDWALVETIATTAVKAALNGAISMIPGGGLIPQLASILSGAIK